MSPGFPRRLGRALSAPGLRPLRPRTGRVPSTGRGPVEPPVPAARHAGPTRPEGPARPASGSGVPAPAGTRPYPGDYPGVPAMYWAPRPDGLPDPGEVVWTWVPYEEDTSVGKDRPVLLVGHDGDWLLGVMLTSRDHDDEPGERRREHDAGRDWVDVGSGAWDRQRRRSEARTDRVVRVDPRTVRREGAVLPREVFDAVAAAVRRTAGATTRHA